MTSHEEVSWSLTLRQEIRFIWPSGFREEDLKILANQKEELPMAAMFVNGSELNEQS